MDLISKLKNRIGFLDNFSRDAILMFSVGLLVNIFALIYRLFMIRKLSPVDYGLLNSLLALLAIISIPAGTIKTVIMKFSSQYHGLNQMPNVGALIYGSLKRVSMIGLILSGFFVFGSKAIAAFLQIPSPAYLVVLGFIMLVSTILPVTLGGLNGLQHFGYLAFNMIVNAGLNLSLGILFVSLGFRVMGALGGWLLAVSIALLISFPPLKEVIKQGKNQIIDFKDKYMFILPVAVMFLCFMALTNIDILLVKHFFSPLKAGYYSIAQMVGRIIFFLPQAISLVMFPKASYHKAQKKDTKAFLKKSLFYASILCFGAATLSILFPALILKILAGKVYPECIALARVFSVNMAFLALVGISVDYFLSTHNFKFIPYMIFFIILEILLILIFHQSLLQVISLVCAVSMAMFFVNLKFVVQRTANTTN